MNAFPFRADQKLSEVLASRSFTISAEVIPPRNGAEQGKVLEQVETLIRSGAQFLAVTKGAGGSLRGGSLPIAQTIKERFGVPCIAHFTCRDLTPAEVENQLMDHHYFGIRNILALRGDPPDGQPEWQPKEGAHLYAYKLIEQIKKLNQGQYIPRPGGPPVAEQEGTDFCIGAAVYPEHPNEKERSLHFKMKVDAGAEYAITQMIFDADIYARFLDLCGKAGIKTPVLPGTRLLKTRPQAERMASKFQVSVPSSLLANLPEADGPDAIARAVDHFMKFAERLKALGAPGIHLFVLADTAGASEYIKSLSTAYPLALAGSGKQVKQ